MQAAGHLVAATTELAAGVEDSEDNFERRHVLALGMFLDGNAATVVDDGARTILVEGYVDLAAKSCERLVDGIIDNLIDKMM